MGHLGFITTEGYEHVLEIARQSVPDGYGNSYFWVKPDRIVPPTRTHRPRQACVDGNEIRPLNEDDVRSAARFFADRDIRTIGVCLITPTPTQPRAACPGHPAREFPDATVASRARCCASIASTSGRSPSRRCRGEAEHRNYVNNIATRLREFSSVEGERRDIPFYVMKSNGGVLSAKEVSTSRSRRSCPGRRRAHPRRGTHRQCGRRGPGAHLRRWRHLHGRDRRRPW